MAFPFLQTSAFFPSSFQDDTPNDGGFDLNLFLTQDSPFFTGYSGSGVSSPPEFSVSCSKSDSESEDSDDDVDPHRFHSHCPNLIESEVQSSWMQAYAFEDAPYLPNGELRSDLSMQYMLPFEDPPVDTEPIVSFPPAPVHFEVSESAGAPTISAPSIANAITFPSRTTRGPSYVDVASDEDADGDSDYDPTEDDDNDDDDDYVPRLEYPTSKKRRAFSQLDRVSPDPSSSLSSSSSPSASSSSRESSVVSSSSKRPYPSFPRRNLQATSRSALRIAKRADPWACPVQGCGWVQRNRRSPDLKRHMETHVKDNKWVCCGVHIENARNYKRHASDKPYEFKGKLMVGGCMRTFARRDALKRHLDNQNIRCVGDLNCYPS